MRTENGSRTQVQVVRPPGGGRVIGRVKQDRRRLTTRRSHGVRQLARCVTDALSGSEVAESALYGFPRCHLRDDRAVVVGSKAVVAVGHVDIKRPTSANGPATVKVRAKVAVTV